MAEVSPHQQTSSLTALCTTPTIQVNALHALYISTQGWQWTWKAFTEGNVWSFGGSAKADDPCQNNWQGVFCDMKTCNILQLILYDYNLHGTLPATIANLTSLIRLDLSVNRINGTIPSALTTLPSLQGLELIANDFTGSIPENIGHLRELQYFSVNRNNFMTGSIPESVGELSQLRGWEVSSYRIHGTIPSTFCQLQNLSELMIVYTALSGSIPNCLSNMTKLTSLKLYQNRLTGTLPIHLCNITQLYEFDVGTNHLHGPVPNCWERSYLLEYFSIYDNHLSGSLPSTLARNRSRLAYLSASNNLLSGSLPDIYNNFHTLTRFNVFFNELTGSIPVMIGNNVLLTDFLVYYNYFSSSLPSSISQFTALSSLDCHRNLLTGSFPSLATTTMLEYLVLQENMFTGSMPSFDIASLFLYNISSNDFIGTIAYSTLNHSLLNYVDISFNRISGSIPSALTMAQHLIELRLCYNMLTGSIAFNSVSTSQLKNIDISNNMITGTLPSSMFDLQSIETIAAVRNCFTGSLPENICNASKALQTLALDGLHSADQCRDRIFTTSPLSSISTFQMKHPIKGSIPSCLFTTYPNLQGLHLAGNGIEGSLPSDLPFITAALTDLQLSHNSLSGTIPMVIQQHNWTNLDLSFNMLYGTISNDLFAHAMANSDGKHPHHLNGTIPEEDTQAYSLALQINHLSGTIPSSIKHLSTINVLDGNIFICNADKSDLPNHDPQKKYYDCGSTNTTLAIVIWIVLAVVLLSIGWLVHRCFQKGIVQSSVTNPIQQWWLYYQASQEVLEENTTTSATGTSGSANSQVEDGTASVSASTTDGGQEDGMRVSRSISLMRSTTTFMTTLAEPMGRAFKTMPDMKFGMESNHILMQRQVYKRFIKFLQRFRYQLLFMMVYPLVILLPVYSALSISFGTYQFKYVWSTSIALLSGVPPAIVLLFLLLLGMLAVRVLYYFARRQYTNYREEILQEEKVNMESKPETISILVVTLTTSLIAVLAINIAFVYSASGSFTSEEKSLISIGLSIFKISWNFILFQFIHRVVTFRSRVLYGGYVMSLDSILKWTAILNTIIIPILAVAMVSPDCFLYTWTLPADVEVSYNTQQCIILYTSADEVPYCYPTLTTNAFSPSFQYSFQCSSNVMANFMNVFIYRFVFQALVIPALWLVLKHLHHRVARDFFAFPIIHAIYMVLVPPLLRVDIDREVDVDSDASKYFTLLNQKLFGIELKVDFAIILVFGWLFPPLAVIGCLSGILRTYFIQILVGRLLYGVAEHPSLQVHVDQVEQEIKSFLVASNYMPSSFIFLAGIEWSLFMFDMVGDVEGWRAGVGACFGFLTGLLIIGILEFIWKRRFVKKQGKARKNRNESVDKNEQIELNERVSVLLNSANNMVKEGQEIQNPILSSSNTSNESRINP